MFLQLYKKTMRRSGGLARPASALFARTFSAADNLIRERVELPGRDVALWTVRGEGPAPLTAEEAPLPLLCLCGATARCE